MLTFEWAGRNGSGAVREKECFLAWYRELQPKIAAAVKQKAQFLLQVSWQEAIAFRVVEGPARRSGKSVKGIYKVKSGKSQAARPLVCQGPGSDEINYLVGCFEKDGSLGPALGVAEKRRDDIESDPTLNRRPLCLPSLEKGA